MALRVKLLPVTDVWEVYSAVYDALKGMEADSLPRINRVYDTSSLRAMLSMINCEYVSKEE
jgi:hypothetical protein